MKTELIDHSPTRKELKIEIEADAVRAAYDEISDRYARLVNIPGFRKGRAPRSVVRTRFRDEIRSEVLQQLVPQAINDAIVEADLRVIGNPDIHLDSEAALDKFGEQPISVHAHVEVLPEVGLAEYKGLEAARRVRPVTDEMVEDVIRGLRESSASLQPVEDRAAQVGDTVTVNFSGRYINPPEEEDLTAEDVDVVLGGEGVLADFTEHLVGTRPDDVKTFTVKYPEDFSSPGLAGKEIEYTATVTAVRIKEMPELDDEWARSLGEGIESVESLRARVRENLEGRSRFESEQSVRDEVMNKLVDAHPFEVPESLVKQQTDNLLRSTLNDMMQRGLDPRQQQQMDWESLRGMFRPQAEREMRGSFLLEQIADRENIEVSDEEIEEEINAIAQAMRQTPEQVRAALTKQGGERSIADRLRHRKALDLIVENANLRDEEWREETAAEQSADETATDGQASETQTAQASSGEPAGEPASDAQASSSSAAEAQS